MNLNEFETNQKSWNRSSSGNSNKTPSAELSLEKHPKQYYHLLSIRKRFTLLQEIELSRLHHLCSFSSIESSVMRSCSRGQNNAEKAIRLAAIFLWTILKEYAFSSIQPFSYKNCFKGTPCVSNHTSFLSDSQSQIWSSYLLSLCQ